MASTLAPMSEKPAAPAAPKTTPKPAGPAFNADPMGWFRARQREVLIVGGTLVGIGAIGGFAWWWQARKAEYASNALEAARNTASGPNGLAQSASMLQRIIDQYAGTDAAQEAVITLAQVRMVNGQHQLAAAALQDFVSSGPKAKYAAPAYGMLGAALESTGRFADAGQNYLEAADHAELDELKAQYLVSAGRAFTEGGDQAKALDAYRRVTKDFSKTPSATEATLRLAEATKGAEPVAVHQ